MNDLPELFSGHREFFVVEMDSKFCRIAPGSPAKLIPWSEDPLNDGVCRFEGRNDAFKCAYALLGSNPGWEVRRLSIDFKVAK